MTSNLTPAVRFIKTMFNLLSLKKIKYQDDPKNYPRSQPMFYVERGKYDEFKAMIKSLGFEYNDTHGVHIRKDGVELKFISNADAMAYDDLYFRVVVTCGAGEVGDAGITMRGVKALSDLIINYPKTFGVTPNDLNNVAIITIIEPEAARVEKIHRLIIKAGYRRYQERKTEGSVKTFYEKDHDRLVVANYTKPQMRSKPELVITYQYKG